MIKKFAILFFSFALLSTAFASFADSTTSSTSSTPRLKKLDLPCVRLAVEKRENAIQAAFDTMSSLMKSALQARKSALMAAWNITDAAERKTAVKDAWAKFKKSKKDAQSAYRKSRLAAWAQFKKDRALCGQGPTGENPGDDISF